MSRPRRLVVLGAAGLLSLALVSCGGATMTAFDATAYVSGVLDETYKGSWNHAFLDLVDLTDGEAKDAYASALEQEYQRFTYQFDLEDTALTDETRAEVMALLTDVCAKAQYSVQPAVPLDESRYAVEVSVRPMDLFLQVGEDTLAGYQSAFAEEYADVDLERLSNEARAALEQQRENDWALGIVQLCRDRLALVNYLDVVPLLVLVAPDGEGLYTMGDNDFSNLSALIVPY